MKIYLSAAFTRQTALRPLADWLRSEGHVVTSTWLYEAARPAHLDDDHWNLALADKDIAEVFAADCIIQDLTHISTTGGMHVEWGVACYPGSYRLRYTLGPAQHGVFQYKAHRHFESEEMLRAFFEVNHSVR